MKNITFDNLIDYIGKLAGVKLVKACVNMVTVSLDISLISSLLLILIKIFKMDFLRVGYDLSVNLISIYGLVALVYTLIEDTRLKPFNSLAINLIVFLIMSYDSTYMYLGPKGIFTAIFLGFITTKLCLFFQDFISKILADKARLKFVIEPLLSSIINSLLILLFLCIRLGLLLGANLLLPQVINGLISPLLMASDSIFMVLFYTLSIRFIWYFGIHGGNVVGAILNPIFLYMFFENSNAYLLDKALPYTFNIIFIQTWTISGVLPLVGAVYFLSKSENLRLTAKNALWPALFNIGEPIIFGLPIVYNKALRSYYYISFTLGGIIPFLAIKLGYLNKIFINLPYTLPAGLKAILGGLDYRGILVYGILMLINFIVFALYVIKDNKNY